MWYWFLSYCFKKKYFKIKKVFSKNFQPYKIGFISKDKKKVNFKKFSKMVKKKTCVFISGQGSNLNNLISHSRDKSFPIEI